jgi:hypothetical protein
MIKPWFPPDSSKLAKLPLMDSPFAGNEEWDLGASANL